jgi:tetratricopeptide (TPR) repeat protein
MAFGQLEDDIAMRTEGGYDVATFTIAAGGEADQAPELMGAWPDDDADPACTGPGAAPGWSDSTLAAIGRQMAAHGAAGGPPAPEHHGGLELRPENAPGLARHARRLFRGQCDAAGADHWYRQALECDPACADALAEHGLLLVDAFHDWTAAAARFAAALRLDPRHGLAAVGLAECRLRAAGTRGTAAEAAVAAALDAAGRFAPEPPADRDAFWAAGAGGRLASGDLGYGHAPRGLALHAELALLRPGRAAGDAAEARACLEHALEWCPSHRPAARLLGALLLARLPGGGGGAGGEEARSAGAPPAADWSGQGGGVRPAAAGRAAEAEAEAGKGGEDSSDIEAEVAAAMRGWRRLVITEGDGAPPADPAGGDAAFATPDLAEDTAAPGAGGPDDAAEAERLLYGVLSRHVRRLAYRRRAGRPWARRRAGAAGAAPVVDGEEAAEAGMWATYAAALRRRGAAAGRLSARMMVAEAVRAAPPASATAADVCCCAAALLLLEGGPFAPAAGGGDQSGGSLPSGAACGAEANSPPGGCAASAGCGVDPGRRTALEASGDGPHEVAAAALAEPLDRPARLVAAARILRGVLTFRPAHAEAWRLYGRALLARGDLEAGIPAMRAAAAAASESGGKDCEDGVAPGAVVVAWAAVDVLCEAGEALARAGGLPAEGLGHVERALALDPTHPHALELAEELRRMAAGEADPVP